MAANESVATEKRSFFKLIAKADKCDMVGRRAIVQVVKNPSTGKYEHGKWFSSLSGYLTNASIKEFEFEGETKNKCTIDITDQLGVCQLEFSFNFATYGFINSLLNTDLKKEVEVKAWITKTGFVGMGLAYIGYQDLIKWSLQKEEIPEGEKYDVPDGKGGKKSLVSFANVEAFWKDKFAEKIIPFCNRSNFAGEVLKDVPSFHVTEEVPAEYKASFNPAENKPDEGDLPF